MHSVVMLTPEYSLQQKDTCLSRQNISLETDDKRKSMFLTGFRLSNQATDSRQDKRIGEKRCRGE
jgi:hypothetical protein